MLQEHVTGSVVAVTDETFAETVLASHRPVLVDFWAPWCPPCTVVSKILAELAEELGDQVLMTEINTDDNPVTTRAYGVMAMPTLLVLRTARSWARSSEHARSRSCASS